MSLGGVIYHRDTYRVYARQYSTTGTSIGSTGDSGIPRGQVLCLWVKVGYSMEIYRVSDSRVQRGKVPGLLMTVELIGDRWFISMGDNRQVSGLWKYKVTPYREPLLDCTLWSSGYPVE